MRKIGIIGDFHFPSRSSHLPRDYFAWFKGEGVDLILCTGDLTEEEVLEELNKIARVIAIKGNCDHLDFPIKECIEVGGIKICLFHGSGIHPRGDKEKLIRIAKESDAKVLVHGHTHRWEAEEYKGVIFINPGSATGAWSGEGEIGQRACAIMEIEGRKVVVRIKVDSEEIKKAFQLK